MAELVYHNGHYHEVRRRDRHHHKRDDPWNVLKFWDEVLYSVGDLYYKPLPRRCLRARTATSTRRGTSSSTARILGSQTARIRALLSVPCSEKKGID
ncbi:hypothetical protein ACQKWADRAFT_130181 [Trichoderma austrokoningii]